MSETSTEKTKRKQIDLLLSYKWVHQISYFYPNYKDSRNILEDGKKIRKRIGRLNPSLAFLCKLRFKAMSADDIENSPSDKKSVVMPYWTIYSTKPFKGSEAVHFLPKGIADVIYTKVQAIQPYRLENAARAIKGQNLYSVETHLGTKANSYYVINQAMLDNYKLDQDNDLEEQTSTAPQPF